MIPTDPGTLREVCPLGRGLWSPCTGAQATSRQKGPEGTPLAKAWSGRHGSLSKILRDSHEGSALCIYRADLYPEYSMCQRQSWSFSFLTPTTTLCCWYHLYSTAGKPAPDQVSQPDPPSEPADTKPHFSRCDTDKPKASPSICRRTRSAHYLLHRC